MCVHFFYCHTRLLIYTRQSRKTPEPVEEFQARGRSEASGAFSTGNRQRGQHQGPDRSPVRPGSLPLGEEEGYSFTARGVARNDILVDYSCRRGSHQRVGGSRDGPLVCVDRAVSPMGWVKSTPAPNACSTANRFAPSPSVESWASLQNLTKGRGTFEEGNHRADHDARLTGRAFALMMKHSSGLSEDKRDSLIRETSRRGHDAEGSLLVAAAGANSGQIGVSKAWSTPKRQRQGVKPGTSGTSRRPISAK